MSGSLNCMVEKAEMQDADETFEYYETVYQSPQPSQSVSIEADEERSSQSPTYQAYVQPDPPKLTQLSFEDTAKDLSAGRLQSAR